MRVLLINLDVSADRFLRMDRIFRANGIAYERVPAVDGLKMRAVDLDRVRTAKGHFYLLGPGEIGSFLSHRRCWGLVAAGQDPHVAIFEDDIHLGEQAASLLSGSSWIPGDADVVKLETTLRKTKFGRTVAARTPGREVVRLFGHQGGSAGYVISHSCAVKLLAATETFCDPIDQTLFNPISSVCRRIRRYIITPALCIQDSIIPVRPSGESAIPSMLHLERKRHEPVGFARHKRRVVAGIKRRRVNALGLVTNLMPFARWGQVPFR